MENKVTFDHLNEVEDCRELIGWPKIEISDLSIFPESLREHIKAYYDTVTTFEAHRKVEDSELDWSDPDQRKYAPYYWMSPSSFAFGGSYCVNGVARAGSGSRLRVRTREASDNIGKKFTDTLMGVQLK